MLVAFEKNHRAPEFSACFTNIKVQFLGGFIRFDLFPQRRFEQNLRDIKKFNNMVGSNIAAVTFKKCEAMFAGHEVVACGAITFKAGVNAVTFKRNIIKLACAFRDGFKVIFNKVSRIFVNFALKDRIFNFLYRGIFISCIYRQVAQSFALRLQNGFGLLNGWFCCLKPFKNTENTHKTQPLLCFSKLQNNLKESRGVLHIINSILTKIILTKAPNNGNLSLELKNSKHVSAYEAHLFKIALFLYAKYLPQDFSGRAVNTILFTFGKLNKPAIANVWFLTSRFLGGRKKSLMQRLTINVRGSTMTNTLISHDFNGSLITQNSNGFLNATSACKAAGKLFADYKRLESTQAYLNSLSAVMGIPITGLIETKQGGNNKQSQGTWVHPHVAVHLAQWLSPEFAVFVTKLFIDYRAGVLAPVKAPTKNPHYVTHHINFLPVTQLTKNGWINGSQLCAVFGITSNDFLKASPVRDIHRKLAMQEGCDPSKLVNNMKPVACLARADFYKPSFAIKCAALLQKGLDVKVRGWVDAMSETLTLPPAFMIGNSLKIGGVR